MPARDPRESKTDVPTQGSRAIFDKLGGPIKMDKFNPQEIPLGSGEILVRLIYSGVCHTDLHAMLGDWPVANKLQETGEPLVGGHEGAGIVVKLGPNADEVKVGDRVGIKWIADACLKCEMCRLGHEASCENGAKTSGYSVDGTFGQYVKSWAKYVTPLPDNLPLDQASPILCAGVTVYRAIKEANLTPGQWVVIPGAGGGLGHLAVQYATALGYRPLAIDTGAEKKELVTRLGAEGWIDFKTSKDIVQDVKNITGGDGAHAAVVASASAQAYTQGLEYIRPRGTLVCVGLPADCKIQADVFFTVFQAKKIVGSYVGNRQDCIEALDMAARGKVKTHFKTMGLTQLNDVYKSMHEGTLSGRIVLDLDR